MCEIHEFLFNEPSFLPGTDNENAGPSEHSKAVPSDRDRKDFVPGDGVR